MTAVLVVEDDKMLQDVIRITLELEGYEVEVAGDAEAANAWLGEHRPSVVLLDWMLPDAHGSVVAAHLRAHHDGVPIVLLTASGQVAEKASAIGAYTFVAKPFDLDVLVGAVRNAMASG